MAFDRYYRYADLTGLLEAFAQEYAEFVDLQSIGKSHEGRDIWLVTVTDKLTGPALEKPAFWVDGNIHASELSASTAALYLLNKLVTEQIELLKTHTFYIVPRLNPDGAEWAMEDPPRIVRSGTRPYPFDDEDLYGIERKDIDGDGRILWMRIPDENGPWTVSELEPRLLRKRRPGEVGLCVISAISQNSWLRPWPTHRWSDHRRGAHRPYACPGGCQCGNGRT